MTRIWTRSVTYAFAASLWFNGSSTYGQTGASCDASVNVGTCQASGRLEGKFVKLETNSPKCAVVGWEYDGTNRLTTVVDGEESIEILQPRNSPIVVRSCTLVKDNRETDDAGSSRHNAACESAIANLRSITTETSGMLSREPAASCENSSPFYERYGLRSRLGDAALQAAKRSCIKVSAEIADNLVSQEKAFEQVSYRTGLEAGKRTRLCKKPQSNRADRNTKPNN